MTFYLTNIDRIALVIYTLYLGGVLGGSWLIWKSTGKQRLWGVTLLLESAAAAILLTLMSSKFWFGRTEGPISIGLQELSLAITSISLPIFLGTVIVSAVVYLVVFLTRRNYATAGNLLTCLLIPIIFAASAQQLILLTKRNKPVEQKAPTKVEIAPGFQIALFREEPVHNPTSIVFGPDNNLYVANYNGDIWGFSTTDGESWLYATGFRVPVGLAWHNNKLYVASHGKVSIVRDENNDHIGDGITDIISGLPARVYPWHANNGIVFGPDERIYFAVGSTSDRSVETAQYAASILSAQPDGSDLSVYAVGVRNPYRLAFNSRGELFATDNGPDGFENTPGDELNHIVQGGDYGFPNEFGIPSPGSSVQAPIALFPPHASADGLIFYHGEQFPKEFYDNAFVSLWNRGEIYRVQLNRDEDGEYITRLSLFASGLSGPLDMTVGLDGSLYVVDFNSNVIYKINYIGENAP